jgi:hypothetical protein
MQLDTNVLIMVAPPLDDPVETPRDYEFQSSRALATQY